MELKLINDQGKSAATVAASDALFGREFNESLVHQIVIAYQANARRPESAFVRALSSPPPARGLARRSSSIPAR